MSRTRLTIDPDIPQDVPVGRVDHEVLDATGEEDITRQARDDDAEARRNMGAQGTRTSTSAFRLLRSIVGRGRPRTPR